MNEKILKIYLHIQNTIRKPMINFETCNEKKKQLKLLMIYSEMRKI